MNKTKYRKLSKEEIAEIEEYYRIHNEKVKRESRERAGTEELWNKIELEKYLKKKKGEQ